MNATTHPTLCATCRTVIPAGVAVATERVRNMGRTWTEVTRHADRDVCYALKASPASPVVPSRPAARPAQPQQHISQGYVPCDGEEGFYGDSERRAVRNQDVYGGDEGGY